MASITVRDDEVRKAFEKGRKLSNNATAELYELVVTLTEHVLRRAKKRTPVLEGHLRRSGTAEQRTGGRQGLVSTVWFGGLAEQYAEVQHEREDFNHPKGGSDHFLYGAKYSAWNDSEERMVITSIDKFLRKAFDLGGQ